MELINSILGFIIAIGILVTFHEYGHFIVARLCNVKVLKFSVGFGKAIFKFQLGKSTTEYSLCAIPLGGYVQMLESKNPEGKKNDVDEKDYHYCFDKKNVYQRFAIVAAGPIFNLILAIIFFTMTYMNGIGGIKPTIQLADNDDKYKIISVNNEKVERWQDVRIEILNNVMNNNQISLSLTNSLNSIRDYKLVYDPAVLNAEGDIIQNIGLNIVYPNREAIIGTVSNKSNNSNMMIGDKILYFDNTLVSTWDDFVTFIHSNPNKTVNITALRSNNTINYPVTILNKNSKGYLGVSHKVDMSDYVNVSYSFSNSISKAISSTTDYTLLTFKMIGRLIMGEANVKNLSGPLSIAQFSGKSLEMGLSYFLYLLAILSVSLGVLNLLPIPMLDGGHLVYYSYEMITGRELPMNIQLVAQFAGVAILGLIMVVAFYNDFVRIFT
ncbi:MAG: RIP metalloprotease RseP [Gammaproteobacteria bacterium]|jgi:regulator of sigma E protease